MQILIFEENEEIKKKLICEINIILPNNNIISNCTKLKQLPNWLLFNYKPDLIIASLDNCSKLFLHNFVNLTKNIPLIILSNNKTFAIQAINMGAVHFLLKPIKTSYLQEAFKRVAALIINKNENHKLDILEPQIQKKYLIRIGSQIKVLEDEEIAYIFIQNKIVYIVTIENRKYTSNYSLDKFEKTLDPTLFYRINRQYIIKINCIKKMQPASKQRIALSIEPSATTKIYTSFERTPAFKKWIQQ
ncbi:MAG: hypothetical protein HOO89_04865 [Ferruginibacter sp.]|nr:hypothetical protein [Ferruginibacter sp.]